MQSRKLVQVHLSSSLLPLLLTNKDVERGYERCINFGTACGVSQQIDACGAYLTVMGVATAN
jgi:hypothetical protein